MNTVLTTLSRRHFIGCGGRSNNVGEMALKDGRFEIVALADYFQEAVGRQGGKFQVPAGRRYTGLNCFKKLLDAGGIDIAAVLSPPYFRPEQVEAAVEAGLHVWLAKPIAVGSPGVDVVNSKKVSTFDTSGLKM
jgi:myo-inositol 2-dehydrogenase/D-chiro-inositol 1-dehydrogenase